MSKIGSLVISLDEQCADYGFTSYAEALEQGFTYEVAEDGTATLTPPSDGLEMAHKAWLKEQEIVLGDLMNLMVHKVYDHDIIERAYKFIKEQCHD